MGSVCGRAAPCDSIGRPPPWLPHALPQAILSTWNFDAKFTLLTAQAALSLAFCIIVMEFWPETAADLHLRPFDMKVMRK